jgi:WD40 repeat protein
MDSGSLQLAVTATSRCDAAFPPCSPSSSHFPFLSLPFFSFHPPLHLSPSFFLPPCLQPPPSLLQIPKPHTLKAKHQKQVYSSTTGTMQYQLKPQGDKESAPTCCIRFRPNTAGSRAKNVLTSVNANGTVRHWHMTSMKCLHTIVEEGNQVYALDYRGDGLKFATAGQDYQVTIPKHKPQGWAQVCDCGAAQRNDNKT